MKKKLPYCQTPPPIYLVQNWLSFINESDEEDKYANKKAFDLLVLFFGSLENANKYVEHNKSI